MKIGVLSDTHGFLDPKIFKLFANVEHIFHAGDIGNASLILELGQIAPVTAVLGNNDAGLNFKETEVAQLAGRKFLLHHILVPSFPREGLRERLERENPDVVIFGHSHEPYCETIGRTLYLNPGYAGKPRFRLPRTVALLECRGQEILTEFRAL